MTNATITQPTQAEFNIQMYGFADIDAYVESVKQSSTYKFTGASMVVAGLLSDAQELLSHGDEQRSRQTLNVAKAILFEIVDGNLVLTGEHNTWKHNAPYNPQFLGAQPARAGEDY